MLFRSVSATLGVDYVAINNAHALFGDNEARRRIEDVNQSLDARLQKLEAAQEANARAQGMLNAQFERVRQEVAQIRGMVEVVTNDSEQLQKRQKDFYIDLDGHPSQPNVAKALEELRAHLNSREEAVRWLEQQLAAQNLEVDQVLKLLDYPAYFDLTHQPLPEGREAILAALATVIASQAVISGVFSLTRQAVRLGYLSPMRIIHTSEMESGQIYIPFINWLLYISVVIVIVNFEHSSNLAAAYGIAVTGTMVLTSILSTTVARKNWHWNKYFVFLILVAFLCVDVPLFSANLDKLISGGWLPLTLGLVMFTIMTTWKSERFRLLRRMHEHGNSLEAMIASLEKSPPVRVPGTAVYMSRAINVIPFALMHNLKHNKVLHERVILLTLRTEDAPYVHNVRRVQIEQLSPTFWRVVASYGWRETPNVEEVFHRCGLEGLSCRMMETSFFMSHESLIVGKRPWYLRLRGKLYLLLQRNALRAPDQFEIPPNRVIELGTQVEI